MSYGNALDHFILPYWVSTGFISEVFVIFTLYVVLGVNFKVCVVLDIISSSCGACWSVSTKWFDVDGSEAYVAPIDTRECMGAAKC